MGWFEKILDSLMSSILGFPVSVLSASLETGFHTDSSLFWPPRDPRDNPPPLVAFLGMVLLDVSKKKLHQPLASNLIGGQCGHCLIKRNSFSIVATSPPLKLRGPALMSPNFRKMLGVLLKLRPCRVAKVCVPHDGKHTLKNHGHSWASTLLEAWDTQKQTAPGS